MEWNIIGIMDGVIERARENHWNNLDKILEEYNIFEEEQKDRKDATVDGVDLSNASSLFSKYMLWY